MASQDVWACNIAISVSRAHIKNDWGQVYFVDIIIIIVVQDNHGTSFAYGISRCCLSRHEQRK
jgi:hypothetical protein